MIFLFQVVQLQLQNHFVPLHQKKHAGKTLNVHQLDLHFVVYNLNVDLIRFVGVRECSFHADVYADQHVYTANSKRLLRKTKDCKSLTF